MKYFYVVLVGIIVAFLGCSRKEQAPVSDDPVSTPVVEIEVNHFSQGINFATGASQLTQTANSTSEWEQVANSWQSALDSMNSVSSDHPDYEKAQERIETYSENIEYAKQNITLLQEKRELLAGRSIEVFNDSKALWRVAGLATPIPVVQIVIPKDTWDGMPKEDQISLILYAESQITTVRSEPASHIGVVSSAPIYNSFIQKASNLCDDCWSIIISYSNIQPYGIDEAVVQGDTPWNADDTCCRGVQGSEFIGL